MQNAKYETCKRKEIQIKQKNENMATTIRTIPTADFLYFDQNFHCSTF